MRIELADGTPYNPSETEIPTMNMNSIRANAADADLQSQVVASDRVDKAPPPRTVATVATELERAIVEHAEHALATANSLARIKALTSESKGFVVKKRAPKGDK